MTKKEFIKLFVDTKIPEKSLNKQKLFQPVLSALLKVIPAQLYRYRTVNENTIDAFRRDMIFCSRPKDFNDPYDMSLIFPDLESIKKVETDYFEHILYMMNLLIFKNNFKSSRLKRLIPEDIMQEIPEIFKHKYDSPTQIYQRHPRLANYLEGLYHHISDETEAIRNNNSYACFSESVTSITMWGHYADYHKGFVLSYDFKSLLEEGIQGIMILPIIYEKLRYDTANLLAWCIGKTLGFGVNRHDMLDVVKCALYKSLDWEYEREWRLVNIRNDYNDHPSIHYAPKAIYYGTRISKGNRRLLHEIAIDKGIAEYDVMMDNLSFDYDMKIKTASF